MPQQQPSAGGSGGREMLDWEEARGFVAFLLLATVVFAFIAATFATIDANLLTWRQLFIVFVNNLSYQPSLLLMGAALLIVSAPAGSLIPGLRSATMWVSLAVSIMGVLFVLNVVTIGLGSALGRIWPAFREGAANAILGGTAAWLCRRVSARG